MTTVQKENAVKEAAIAGLPEAIAASMETLVAHQLQFESALAEVRRHDEEISRFEKARDASKAAADEANTKIRSEFKVFGISSKEAVKLKSLRNGHLEDAENFQALIDDILSVRKSAEVQAHESALAYKSAKREVRDHALKYLEGCLANTLSPELLMFVELTAEMAGAGESILFNADPTVHEPMEFATRRVSALISSALKVRDSKFGSSSFLPESPSDIGSYGKSQLQIIALKRQIADAQSVKN